MQAGSMTGISHSQWSVNHRCNRRWMDLSWCHVPRVFSQSIVSTTIQRSGREREALRNPPPKKSSPFPQSGSKQSYFRHRNRRNQGCCLHNLQPRNNFQKRTGSCNPEPSSKRDPIFRYCMRRKGNCAGASLVGQIRPSITSSRHRTSPCDQNAKNSYRRAERRD